MRRSALEILGLGTVLVGLTAPLAAGQEAQVRREERPDGTVLEWRMRAGDDGVAVAHGPFLARSADGQTLVRGKFSAGKRTGRWHFRRPDGEPWVNGAFRQGARDGKWTFLDAAGEVRAEGSYESDLFVGPWRFWRDDGEVDERLSGDFRPVRIVGSRAVPLVLGTTVDGAPHGRWTTWWPNGERQLEAELVRGERVGRWSFRHPEGTDDPDLLAGDRGAGAFLSEVEPGSLALARLFPVQPEGDEPPIDPRSTADPSRLEELEPHPGTSSELLVELRAALTAYREAQAEEREWYAVPLQRVEAVPLLLNALARLDLAAEEGARSGALIAAVLTAYCGGHGFGWRASTAPEDVALNRLAILRWTSLYLLCAEQPAFWELDRPLAPAPEPGAGASAFLLDPPLAWERRAADPSRAARLRAAGGAGTEAALDGALDWLARHQSTDGSWDADGFAERVGCDCGGTGVTSSHDVGVTGLALLALLRAGHTPESGRHAGVVRRGLHWLMARQHPDTGRFQGTAPTNVVIEGVHHKYAYSFPHDHAVATQALCEALAISPRRSLRSAAQRALNQLAQLRNPYGAWGYPTPPNGDNTTPATAFAVLALRAGEAAGLAVDPEAYVGARSWIDEITDPSTGRVGYRTIGSLSSRVPGGNEEFPWMNGETLTAMGLLVRLELGQRSEPPVEKHLDLIRKRLPEWAPEDRTSDMVYWLFGTWATHRVGGRYWTAWNRALKKALVDTQREDGHRAGSWDAVGPWGFAGGRVFATAAMALCLEVYYAEAPWLQEGQANEAGSSRSRR